MLLLPLFRVLFVVLLVALVTPAYGLGSCATGCTPWQSEHPCARKDRLLLRMALDISSENYWGDSLWENVSYAFCPNLDKLQLMNLKDAALYTAGAVDKTTDPPHFSLTTSLGRGSTPHYLSVYGFGPGNRSTREWPPKGNSSGAIEFATNGEGPCSDSDLVAVVNVLVLEVGLHKGLFNYIGSAPAATTNVSNPNYDPDLCEIEGGTVCEQFLVNITPAVAGLPAKTGFVPTCKYNAEEGKDICLFDENSACIGSVMGQRNCGRCYGPGEDDMARLLNASTQVFVSYYGTDSKNRALTSGGLNPLNYLSFSGGIFSTISSKLQGIWSGGEENVTDYFTNPNFPWN